MKRFLLFCSVVVLSCAGAARAQFPAQAVTLLVPAPQGDIVHTTARLIAGKLTEHWGRAVFADAKPQHDGVDAIVEAAKAKPDGHVLLLGTIMTHAILPSIQRSLPYDAQKAYAPVTLLIELPMVMLVDPSTKVQSPRDLAALAKPKAPPLKSISAASGSPAQLAAMLFESVSRIPLVHAASKDDAQAIAALGASTAIVAFVPLDQALPHIKSGKLRALAVTSAQRSPALPKLQTVAESGITGYELAFWAGLFAPAGTPVSTIDRIAKDANRAVSSADARHALEQRGVLVIGSNPAQFRARIERDRERSARLLKGRDITG